MPDFGNTSSTGYATALATAVNRLLLCRFQAPADGTINSVSAWLSGTVGTNQPIIGLVYADSASAPAAKLGAGVAFTVGVNAPAQWFTSTGLSVAITISTYYWLGLYGGSTSSAASYYNKTGVAGKALNYRDSGTYPNPPDPAGTMSTVGGYDSAFYATYSTGGVVIPDPVCMIA